MSDLVGNPEDRFSHVENHCCAKHCITTADQTNCLFEPHREKTGFLPRRKQRRRSASR